MQTAVFKLPKTAVCIQNAGSRQMTVVWAVALLGEASVQVVLAFVISPAMVLLPHCCSPP